LGFFSPSLYTGCGGGRMVRRGFARGARSGAGTQLQLTTGALVIDLGPLLVLFPGVPRTGGAPHEKVKREFNSRIFPPSGCRADKIALRFDRAILQ
jgi:hypothetical protein